MDRMTETRLHRLIERCGHRSHTHLYYLGDKEWFWDSKREAVIAYRSIGNRRIALGDPSGHPRAMKRVVQQFVESCKRERCIPAFYQTKSDMLPVYRELGMRAAKIGEEAIIDLAGFHLNGKAWLKQRNRLSKFRKSGYEFRVVMPPYTGQLLDRLEAVSSQWLQKRKEKSFSVGAFSREYVSRFPVALMTGPDGGIEAFLTVAGACQVASGDAQLTVDLMRYSDDCPQGTMDYLILSLCLWAKEQGFGHCSLGMAPLANINDMLAARLLYKYGNRLYNFKGLYEFKNKFEPNWEDTYLVFPPAAFSVTAALVTLMVHTPVSPARRTMPDRYPESSSI
ncbi:phosphatidylglycerol lysyltransferase domain-containing protein [Paenibacillus soyae]|uniref:Phosphatidylglycerol lysyltransferase domain-containing protein n=1 Tax=Paenibacillus soyae TaxID=2969249 RepID=A0A9X2SAN0_9BACL|nr:phosphatidylglycerol lysyltransferase domain-containing protein [Paenibacillus soyae]MCR2806884.1 phosphatidylglycerol lysyltransferase domain-containing protein [Paenibacillus soyae]